MKLDSSLSSARIRIRNYHIDDLSFLTSMWFDPENGRYMSDPDQAHVDEIYQKALNELQCSNEGYYLVIEHIASGIRIGSCCLFPDESRRVFDIGYCIHKEHWKKGYGSETIQLLINWIKSLGGEKITAEVAAENAASNALLKKYGFAIEKETEFKKYNMNVRFKSFIYSKTL